MIYLEGQLEVVNTPPQSKLQAYLLNCFTDDDSGDEEVDEYEVRIRKKKLYNRFFGDYKCYLEQLHNFEWTFRERLFKQDSQRANGDTNLILNEKFFEQQKKLRTQLIKDLDQAQADAASLRQRCIQEGIPFEDDSFLTIPDDSVSQYAGSNSRDNFYLTLPSPGLGLVESWQGYYDSAEEFTCAPSGMIPWGEPEGEEKIPSLDVPPPSPPPSPPPN
ncbi:hypothetical protein GQ43DRAFT_500486 [Delitschia confertaspora ATCC 74209]|uniref:Uncharacterized protein n=1 Tax=Delitschia confertaspora ATCC 74209 TaxID=1513339 RepID=A0A9P4JY18_9PLEO|nr:hypothetical protein GQ43DRAFT_500486 [Delitschia confertaspora ATCC 74209]